MANCSVHVHSCREKRIMCDNECVSVIRCHDCCVHVSGQWWSDDVVISWRGLSRQQLLAPPAPL